MALFTHEELKRVPSWEFYYDEVFKGCTILMNGKYYPILDLNTVDWNNGIFYLNITDEHLKRQVTPSQYRWLHPSAGKGEWTVSESEYAAMYNEIVDARKKLMHCAHNADIVRHLEGQYQYYESVCYDIV